MRLATLPQRRLKGQTGLRTNLPTAALHRRRLLQASAGLGLVSLGGCAIDTGPIQSGA